MVYTTALDKFTALTQRATAEAVAAAPAGPTESIPVGISKAALKSSMGEPLALIGPYTWTACAATQLVHELHEHR